MLNRDLTSCLKSDFCIHLVGLISSQLSLNISLVALLSSTKYAGLHSDIDFNDAVSTVKCQTKKCDTSSDVTAIDRTLTLI